MRLRRFLLRYHPPGLIIEYERRGVTKTKEINLFELTPEDDPEAVAMGIIENEALIKSTPQKFEMITGKGLFRTCSIRDMKNPILEMIKKLQLKMGEVVEHKFNLVRVIKAHMLPITNVSFNKMSTLFCTGSYDRTCKVFDTNTGREIHSLEGHQNVVYTVCFNNPSGTMIGTGSFDKTAKIWHVQSGECLATLEGHTAEVVAVQFSSGFIASI